MSDRNESSKLRRTGSSQMSRHNALLDAGNLKIDGRTLADYITFTYRLAGKVNFFDLQNRKKGNWQQFFGADESILLARISILDITEIEEQYKAVLKDFEQEYDERQKTEGFLDLFTQIMALVLKLDGWYQTSLNYNLKGKDTGLGVQIKNAVVFKLKSTFEELVAIAKAFDAAGFSKKVKIKRYKFDDIWGNVENIGKHPDMFKKGGNRKAQMLSESKHLTLIFKEFLGVVGYIVRLAPGLLEHSLEKDKSHSPQNALFIAFLKLYEHVVDDLNDITRKHLDYYFFDKLGQKLSKSRADKVFLCFALADNIDRYTLEKGTLLEAGTDEEGLSYLYSCDHDLVMNKATLSDIKIVYVSKNRHVTDGERFKQIANIYQADIASSQSGTIDFGSQSIVFPTFGEDQFGANPDHPTMITSKIGFAIASPILILTEGIRHVEVNLKFDLKSMSSLVSFLESYTISENMTAEGAFFKIFSDSFDITLSTIEGWYGIDDYKISPPVDWSEGIMRISFTLDQTAPPITAFEADAEQSIPYDTNWPIIRFLLSADNSMYTYSYLDELELEYCEIHVDVKKIKNLKLFNNLGKLDTGNPFFPFGSVPTLGSYLVIGHDEIDIKEIEDIVLHLQWHNLPLLEGGFKEHYKEYGEDINNDSFLVSLKALSGYEFLPKNDDTTEKFKLFETTKTSKGETPHERVKPSTDLRAVDTSKLQIKADYSYQLVADYDNTVKSGYLKLELVAPRVGFGHELYPNLFANIVLKNSTASSKNPVKLPNTPYIPQLRSLEMNYQAKTRIAMTNDERVRGGDPSAGEKMYHVLPFGIRTTFQNGIASNNHLVHQYDSEGYLLLGFQGLNAGQVLTLYFSLEAEIGNAFEVNLPKVRWEYLANDEWVNLEDREVIFDGTNDFTASGIVKLMIPKAATRNNHILPSGRIWLGARVEGDVSLLSKTKGIYTQALSATWMPHKEGAEWEYAVPANTINTFAVTKSEIASIIQPDPSFHGRSKETMSKFYLRVSERLRHKNRAITTWDFEQLILEKYPFIEQVQCLTSLQDERISSGSVLLVTVQEIRRDRPFYYPKLSYDTLEHLQKYVNGLSTPFSKIRLVNPVFEKVKVNAHLLFIDNSMKGEFLLRLNEDIRRFLCPWFYDQNIPMIFGGGVRLADLLAFIEGKDYIRSVTKVSIIIIHNQDEIYSLSDSAIEDSGEVELFASTPWSVLVPIENHQFTVVDEDVDNRAEKAAIEKMTLGEDFVLAEESDRLEDDDFPGYESGGDQDYFVIEFGEETLDAFKI